MTSNRDRLGRQIMYFVQIHDGNGSMHRLQVSLHQRRFFSFILSQAPIVTAANESVACAETLQSQNHKAMFSALNIGTHIECSAIFFLDYNETTRHFFP